MTIAYSALGSVGIWISATEGDCGSVDGRGILFDLYVLPVENILQSYRLLARVPQVLHSPVSNGVGLTATGVCARE